MPTEIHGADDRCEDDQFALNLTGLKNLVDLKIKNWQYDYDKKITIITPVGLESLDLFLRNGVYGARRN